MKILKKITVFIFICLIVVLAEIQGSIFPLISSAVIDIIPNDIILEDYKDKLQSVGLFKETIIYNGTRIEDAIRSTSEIDNKAKLITKDCNTDREKAKELYKWIGSNIIYDDDKAEIVLNGDDNTVMPESGAEIAYKMRSGICFDKAALYVAMARAAGLKVRLISGEAYDGEKYVGHAWNEVYLSDEEIWISVDPTFYNGGDYFDSNLFSKHIVENIAGEWNGTT